LVLDTFGNVSGLDAEAGIFYIKPSGVPYEELIPALMVPVSLETGEVLGGELRPSTDTSTHRELYLAFGCGAVSHSHSELATVLAQSMLPVRCMGTTHADFFHGDIPVTRDLTDEEIQGEYEVNTGRIIVETFRDLDISPQKVPGALVARHGPFTWGSDPAEAVRNSVILEYLARMDATQRALHTSQHRPPPTLIDKHFLRKHGDSAYYGQE
jgi:L-ribulose-5-phosphate 4-epimerase